jgi:hypothetical protein
VFVAPTVSCCANRDGDVGGGAERSEEGGYFGPGDGEAVRVEKREEGGGGTEAIVARRLVGA